MPERSPHPKEHETLKHESFYREKLIAARTAFEKNESRMKAAYEKFPNDRAAQDIFFQQEVLPERKRLQAEIDRLDQAWRAALEHEYSADTSLVTPGEYRIQITYPRKIKRNYEVVGTENSVRESRFFVRLPQPTMKDLMREALAEISMDGLHNYSIKFDEALEAAEVFFTVQDSAGQEITMSHCFVDHGGHIILPKR